MYKVYLRLKKVAGKLTLDKKNLLRLVLRVVRRLPLPRKVKLAIMRICHNLLNQPLMRFGLELLAVIVLLPALGFSGYYALTRPNYTLTQPASLLAGKADSHMLQQVSYDAKDRQYIVNKAGMNSSSIHDSSMQVGGSSNNSAGFSAKLSRRLSDGVIVYDDSANISFAMTAQFATAPIKNLGSHFLYPATGGVQVLYTVKNDGVKEDLVLNKPVGNRKSFQYQLKLPDYLQARLEKNGAVGIYSASPQLFGNITYGSDADRAKVAAARQNGAKTNLVFELLPPVINDSNGKLDGAATNAHAKFGLQGNILTVTATGLAKLHYPVSIDPSVLVASAFNQQGNNDGGVSVTSGQVTESGLTGGDASAWSYTCNSGNNGNTYSCGFSTGREYPASVAYDGYLYVMGGHYTAPGSASWSSAGSYNWTVPNGVSSINVDMYGAPGGTGDSYIYGGGAGGYGGRVTGTINVTAGTTLTMLIGGNGNAGTYNGSGYTPGGYNGGGGGGWDTNGSNGGGGGSGGGCTTLKNGSTILASAPGGGGGGGAGAAGAGGGGGYGGGTSGAAGAGGGGGGAYGTGGGGGTTSGGGGGDNSGGNNGGYGGGGAGSGGGGGGAGGGAGCGYYGGGGGGEAGNDGKHTGGGGGGGGAAYVPGGGASYANVSSGYGSATITYTQDIYLNDVQYAPINSNGTIGTWASTSSFSTPRFTACAVVYNGYMYLMGGSTGTSVLNDVQYAKINANGTLGSWTPTTSFSTARMSFEATVNNGYVYILGGDNTNNGGTGNFLNDVQYAPINSNGTLGTWHYTYNSGSTSSFSGGYAITRQLFGVTIYNNYVYVAGGYTSSGAANDVQYARINPDGTIGTWNVTTSFITSRWSFAMTVYDGYLYIAGGYNGSSQVSDVQYAPIYAGGSIGPWSEIATGMNVARWGLGFVPYGGYLYILGGDSNGANTQDCTTNSTMCNGVQYAQISSAGGTSTWANNANSLGTAVRQACSVAYNGYLYVLGGYSDTLGGSQSLVQYAALNADGSTGAWATTTSFSIGRHDLGCAAYNGYMYVIGGTEYPTSDTNCKNTGVASQQCNDVQYAQINSTGTVGTWTTTSYFTNPRRGLGVAAYNGYLYVVGGGNANTSTYYNDVQYAQINSTGTVGTWNATSSFNVARWQANVFEYGNYLYLLGGAAGASSQDCTTGTGFFCSGVQYAPINSNGTLGSWSYTHNSTNDGNTFVSGFTTAASEMTGGVFSGYIYIAGGSNGSNITRAQYAPINSNGTIGAWNSTTSQSTATAEQPHDNMIYNGILYTFGGDQGGSAITTITYTHINNGGPGTLGSGSGASSLPQALNGGSAVAYNGYFYYLAGHTTASGAADTANVYYAPFSSAGTLGGWNTTSTLPQILDSATTVTYDGYIYEIGGANSSLSEQSQATVYYANINSNGTLGAWQTATNSLPQPLDSAAAVQYNGYIYVMGGGDNGTNQSTVYYAPIGAGGAVGAWNISTNSLPLPTELAGSTVYNGYIYLVGGWSGGAVASAVYYSQINANGTIGAWNKTASLQIATDYNMAVAYNGYLYAIGGANGAGTLQAMQEYTPINANGALGSWQATTPLSTGLATAGLVASNGYRCLLGGNNGGYTSTVNCAAFNSMPRIGRYTLQLDLTQQNNLDVSPASIVISGTNSGNPGMGSSTPGQGGVDVQYEFADDNCSAWSVPPGVSNVPLGTHNILGYSQNGCGTATNQARYVWAQVVLDDSQTATFPDSSSNHTSMTGVSVYYHANSGNRLRGGATFMNQSLQSLDTSPSNAGLASPTYSTLNNGLAGYYPFNGNASDQSGNNNNGTVNGAVLTNDKNGSANSAYSFNGSTSNITVSSLFGLGTGSYSIGTWAYVPSTSDHGAFVKIGSTTTGVGIGMGSGNFDTAGDDFIILFENVRWIDTGVTIPVGWHHFAVTVSSSGVPTAYMDGVLLGSFSGSGPNAPATSSYIGGYNTSRWFNGSLDNVRIYNRELTSTEVQQLYSLYL